MLYSPQCTKYIHVRILFLSVVIAIMFSWLHQGCTSVTFIKPVSQKKGNDITLVFTPDSAGGSGHNYVEV